MNWPEACATLAVITNTSLPDVWRFTFRQFSAYMECVPRLIHLHNPLAALADAPRHSGSASGGSLDADKDPRKALNTFAAMGFPVRKRNATDR